MSTAAIEGNPLTEEEVGRIVKGGEVSGVYQQEILNLKKVYDIMEKMNIPDFPFTEEKCKFLHQKITDKISHKYNIPGNYRKEKVKVGDEKHGGVYVSPKCLDDIRMLMPKFVEWFEGLSVSIHPFLKAFILHYYFAKIHPFSDGNGRTARVLEGMCLTASGYGFFMKELSNYYYRRIDDNYIAFSKSHRTGDVTHFLYFCLDIMKAMLHERKKDAVFLRSFSQCVPLLILFIRRNS